VPFYVSVYPLVSARAVARPFTYTAPEGVGKGAVVSVPFGRASVRGGASWLLTGLVGRGLRTICFTKSRKSAELIHRFASDRVDATTAARLAPYRAGYTPQQRREIERRLVEKLQQGGRLTPQSRARLLPSREAEPAADGLMPVLEVDAQEQWLAWGHFRLSLTPDWSRIRPSLLHI